jgi:hypothetical protein
MQKIIMVVLGVTCNAALFATLSPEFLQLKKELEDLKAARLGIWGNKAYIDERDRIEQASKPLIDKNIAEKVKKMVLLEQQWPAVKKELDEAVLMCANQPPTSDSVVETPQFSSSCRLCAQFLDMMFVIATERKNKQLYAELKPYAQKLQVHLMDAMSKKTQGMGYSKSEADEFAKQTLGFRLNRDQ